MKSGERVNLSAEGSSDPDGHALSYEWFYYGEPGTLLLASGRTGAPLTIEDATSAHGLVHGAGGHASPRRCTSSWP